tara:strand:- start:1373 stop:2722 length:1350 start_codon:yes stop_codon:yes gene_type:complete
LLCRLSTPNNIEKLEGPNIEEAINSRINTSTQNEKKEESKKTIVDVEKAFNARSSYIERQRPDPSVKTNLNDPQNERLLVNKNKTVNVNAGDAHNNRLNKTLTDPVNVQNAYEQRLNFNSSGSTTVKDSSQEQKDRELRDRMLRGPGMSQGDVSQGDVLTGKRFSGYGDPDLDLRRPPITGAQQVCISLVPSTPNCQQPQQQQQPQQPNNYNLQVLPLAQNINSTCNVQTGPPQYQQQPPVEMPVKEGRDTSVSKMGVVNTHDKIEYMVPDMRKVNKEVEKEILLSDFTRSRDIEKPVVKPLAKQIAPHIQTVSEYTTGFRGMPMHLPTQYDIRRPTGIKKSKHYIYEGIPPYVPKTSSGDGGQGGLTDNKFHENKICNEDCNCKGKPVNMQYRFDNNWMRDIKEQQKAQQAQQKAQQQAQQGQQQAQQAQQQAQQPVQQGQQQAVINQ